MSGVLRVDARGRGEGGPATTGHWLERCGRTPRTPGSRNWERQGWTPRASEATACPLLDFRLQPPEPKRINFRSFKAPECDPSSAATGIGPPPWDLPQRGRGKERDGQNNHLVFSEPFPSDRSPWAPSLAGGRIWILEAARTPEAVAPAAWRQSPEGSGGRGCSETTWALLAVTGTALPNPPLLPSA